MNTIRILLAVLGLSLAALVTVGQEAEGEPEGVPPAAEEPATVPAAEPAAEAAAEPTGNVPSGASDEVFIPTVEVQADEEVVFPVDI